MDKLDHMNFQYPRTDRRCCDQPAQAAQAPVVTAFSILERIDDVVTSEGRK